MEFIELNNAIEKAKANYELAKSEDEAVYYKIVIQDLRNEKKELMNKFKRS